MNKCGFIVPFLYHEVVLCLDHVLYLLYHLDLHDVLGHHDHVGDRFVDFVVALLRDQ